MALASCPGPSLPAHPLISHTGEKHCGPTTVHQWRLGLILTAHLKAMLPQSCILTGLIVVQLGFRAFSPAQVQVLLSLPPGLLSAGKVCLFFLSSIFSRLGSWLQLQAILTEVSSVPRHFLLAPLSASLMIPALGLHIPACPLSGIPSLTS